MLEEALRWADHREADPLYDAGVPQREGGRRDPADDAHDHRRREGRETDPTLVVAGRIDVVEIVEQSRGEHESDVAHDEHEEPGQHQEVRDRAVWMLRSLLIRLKRVDRAGDMPSPVMSASGAATKSVTKYASS